jgi:hypothetical protein
MLIPMRSSALFGMLAVARISGLARTTEGDAGPATEALIQVYPTDSMLRACM